MNCTSCSRKTLGLFIRSFINTELQYTSRSTPVRGLQASRFSSVAYRPQEAQEFISATSKPSAGRQTVTYHPPKATQAVTKPASSELKPVEPKKKERWQIEKAAIKAKLGGEAWNPRKKLSPDTMEGIRHLNQTQPQRFTTPLLAQHFKVSPEAIRRILKSKWQPSDGEREERLKRWDKRGERIWSNLVEMGVKPPKRWREMGVGRASPGQRPMWKSRSRNLVPVNDSTANQGLEHDIIPIVDGRTGQRSTPLQTASLAERML